MAVRQLSDGNDDGQVLGQSASDLVSFHGVAPVAQQVIAALATNATAGTVRTAVITLAAALRTKGLIG